MKVLENIKLKEDVTSVFKYLKEVTYSDQRRFVLCYCRKPNQNHLEGTIIGRKFGSKAK